MDSTEFFERLQAGEKLDCPCCGRYAQIYKRKLHATMAYQLITLHRIQQIDSDFIHVSRVATPTGTNDFSKLRYWNLIEEMPKDEDDTTRRTSGYWKITERGKSFVGGNTRVPEHVILWDGEQIGVSDDTVTIIDCLGDKFDYQELMA